MDIWMDRENAIVNSILSADNRCGTLRQMMDAGRETLEAFVRGKVRPTLRVCKGEADRKDREIAALSRDIEMKRRALDALIANLAIPPGPIMDIVKAAMPGDPRLK